ncbi:MAG: porin family protein [Bacteroidota bacterium]|nr:porin family protein [Bacteroidota bacterium]
MRKLLISMLVAISATLSAQVRLDKPEMYFGANFGVTESMVLFNPTISQGLLMGYNGGIVFRYIAEKNVGMQAELNFSQRGWKESSGLYSRQLDYVELPFMTHIYVGNKNRFFINLGPKISYLLSDRKLLNNTGASTDVQHVNPVKYPFDYGLCGGLGLLFNINGKILQLDTRASYSLSDLFADSKSDYFSNSNNLNFSVNLAWLFQVK